MLAWHAQLVIEHQGSRHRMPSKHAAFTNSVISCHCLVQQLCSTSFLFIRACHLQ